MSKDDEPARAWRRAKKRPIVDSRQLEELLDAAMRLSPEHWEVVLILAKTGIELKALRSISWRDIGDAGLIWRRPKLRDEVTILLDEPDLVRAVDGFVRRPRRSSDRLERLVREAREETRNPELADVSPMRLRLTRCYALLMQGESEERAATLLNLKPAIVHEVALLSHRSAKGRPTDER